MAALRAFVSFAWYALVYVGLGLVSLQTTYLDTSAAAFWIPTGFSVGLILARGWTRWPVVAAGAFGVNWIVLATRHAEIGVPAQVLVAAAIALGNTLEAVAGAWLTRRFADGIHVLARPRAIISFASTAVPIAPLASVALGVAATAAGGFVPLRDLPEMTATWYLADAIGLLIFTGPTLLCLEGRSGRLRRMMSLEGVALLLAIVFVGQSICGIYVLDGLAAWPRTYMIVPLLLWASFRFGTSGAMAAVVLLSTIALLGTMRGFRAFPADTPTESLLVLQVFLALMAITALSISAALDVIASLQRNLETTVLARSRDIEHLLRERELLSGLIAHDVKGPVLDSRNTLRALRHDLEAAGPGPTTVEAIRVLETTLDALAERVSISLSVEAVARRERADPNLLALLGDVLRARGHEPGWIDAHVVRHGDFAIVPQRPWDVAFILDVLIDNAVRYGDRAARIDLFAFRHGRSLEITVRNRGQGLSAEAARTVFKSPFVGPGESGGSGVGLYLASEQARSIGGRLSYLPQPAGHATFRLILSG